MPSNAKKPLEGFGCKCRTENPDAAEGSRRQERTEKKSVKFEMYTLGGNSDKRMKIKKSTYERKKGKKKKRKKILVYTTTGRGRLPLQTYIEAPPIFFFTTQAFRKYFASSLGADLDLRSPASAAVASCPARDRPQTAPLDLACP